MHHDTPPLQSGYCNRSVFQAFGFETMVFTREIFG